MAGTALLAGNRSHGRRRVRRAVLERLGARRGGAPDPTPSETWCLRGTEDPFIAHVLPLFRQARDIAILAAFVQGSGVERLEAQLESSLERGCRIRLLTGDYLNITPR